MAFKNLSGNLLYDNFKKEVEIDGIWDDHDMGINDGGKHVNKIRERQDMFINYITGDKRSLNTSDGGKTEIIDGEEYFNTDSGIKARESSENNLKNEERRRDDLSKVIDKKFGKNGPNVRFILLDTRSHRDNHYIKSLGEIKLPLTPLIAAFVRASYSVMGLGREHEGDIKVSVLLHC